MKTLAKGFIYGSIGFLCILGLLSLIPSKDRDYQLKITIEGTTIYDGNRVVGYIDNYDSISIEDIILDDNQ